jgi:cation:H+ antiporter
MDAHPVLLFLGGLGLIVVGAEMLLRGAARVAAMLGISRLVIGLTVVSIGTSAPELAVGITSALEGKGALAVGNIAGTNILNILFILGLSAALRPLPTRLLTNSFDVPVMIGAAVALLVVASDGVIHRWEGLLLMLGGLAYTVCLLRVNRSRSGDGAGCDEGSELTPTWNKKWSARAVQVFVLLAGMGLTVLGAHGMVEGAVHIAKAHGVSDAFIGLTIVAIGTSAPELVTTLMATWKNDRDVAIGNLIGSSIYNILIILGLTCVVVPGGVDVSKDVIWIDMPLAAIVAMLCLPLFKSGSMVSRLEGASFVVAYLAYLFSLIWLRA